jgi:WD40 repeat protein
MRSRKLLTISMVAILLFGLSPTANDTLAQGNGMTAIILPYEHYDFVFSPDGHTVAVYSDSSWDEEPVQDLLPIRLYDIANGVDYDTLSPYSNERIPQDEITSLTTTEYPLNIAFSPDGSLLAAEYPNGYIYLWDVENGEITRVIPWIVGFESHLAFMPDGNHLLTMRPRYSLTEIMQHDLSTETIVDVFAHRFDSMYIFNQEVNTGDATDYSDYYPLLMSVSPDGTQCVTVTTNGTIWRWDLNDSIEVPVRIRETRTGMPRQPIRSISFTPDGANLIYWDREINQIELLEVSTGNLIQTIPTSVNWSGLAFSPNGQTIVGADMDQVYFMNLLNPRAVTSISVSPNVRRYSGLSFTPDGSQIVVPLVDALLIMDVP